MVLLPIDTIFLFELLFKLSRYAPLPITQSLQTMGWLPESIFTVESPMAILNFDCCTFITSIIITTTHEIYHGTIHQRTYTHQSRMYATH